MKIDGSFYLDSPSLLFCDVLVIGSGAGGSVIAHEIIKAGRDVLMLEEGPFIRSEIAPISVSEGVEKMWRNGGVTAAIGNTPIAYAEGSCVGGGTEVNSAIVQRAPNELLDQWAIDFSIKSFGSKELKPYYDKAYQAINATSSDGELGVPSDLLKKAAEKKGWEFTTLDRAQSSCVGTNMCSSGCPTGAKQSMSQTLVRESLAQGLRLVARCRVYKLILNGQLVVGAKAIATAADGSTHKVSIRCRTAFVCAGAIQTPALLRASGVTHAIGNSLCLHPTIKILAQFPFQVDAHLSRLPLYAVTQFMPNIRLGGSVFVPGFFGMAIAEDWERRKHLLPLMSQCGMYYAMIRAKGKGKIRPLIGHKSDPVVTFNLTNEDLDNLVKGLIALAELMFAAGAKHLYLSLSQHEGWSSMDQVRYELVSNGPLKKSNLMTIHLFSSCPMGEDSVRCATDSFGRVHGKVNLYVSDASLIPEAPGVNPQATVMAIAYRNADNWLANNL